jgi:O-acetyl-ADP-ribose deacetylase (regulator of RNase III)
MPDKLQINNSTLRLARGDIADTELEAFVFYARHDLALGSGFGTAISIRGGPSVQESLNRLGPLETTQAIISPAGEMKAGHIIHAVGPRFQEEDLEDKLRQTIRNVLKCAEDNGLKTLAFPPMGTGFYGVPLEQSARVTIAEIADYLAGETGLKEVVIYLADIREQQPFESYLSTLTGTPKETA